MASPRDRATPTAVYRRTMYPAKRGPQNIRCSRDNCLTHPIPRMRIDVRTTRKQPPKISMAAAARNTPSPSTARRAPGTDVDQRRIEVTPQVAATRPLLRITSLLQGSAGLLTLPATRGMNPPRDLLRRRTCGKPAWYPRLAIRAEGRPQASISLRPEGWVHFLSWIRPTT